MADLTLVTLEEIKDRFPDWELYARRTQQEDAAEVEARLERAAEDAETELLEYLPALTPETISPQVERHLLVIAKKALFDYKHGNQGYEHKPLIVRDYEATLATLERYRAGELPVPGLPGEEDVTDDTFTVTPVKRRFGEWFI